jgi:hypothetical protein
VTGERDVTLVMPIYASRLSLRYDPRVTERFLTIALEALSAARPGTAVVLRPHPSDHDLGEYPQLAGRFRALDLEVDASSPIYDVIDRCDLCLTGVSTAALQAAIRGLPVIFLGDAHHPHRPPFGGGPEGFPRASTTAELRERIPEALARRGERAPDSLDDALGRRGDAGDRVLAALRAMMDPDG